jgi:hypothetical protein
MIDHVCFDSESSTGHWLARGQSSINPDENCRAGMPGSGRRCAGGATWKSSTGRTLAPPAAATCGHLETYLRELERMVLLR